MNMGNVHLRKKGTGYLWVGEGTFIILSGHFKLWLLRSFYGWGREMDVQPRGTACSEGLSSFLDSGTT